MQDWLLVTAAFTAELFKKKKLILRFAQVLREYSSDQERLFKIGSLKLFTRGMGEKHPEDMRLLIKLVL